MLHEKYGLKNDREASEELSRQNLRTGAYDGNEAYLDYDDMIFDAFPVKKTH